MVLLLCLLFTLPLQQQNKPETYKCKLVNFDPKPTLVCNDKQQTVLEISYFDWPTVWHGPELDFSYEAILANVGDSRLMVGFIPSQPDEEKLNESIKKSREHQLRWMREPLQNPRKL